MVVLSAELGPELSTASTPSTGALPTTKRALAACGLRAALGFTFAALAYVRGADVPTTGGGDAAATW